jgi:hypothetical protein
MVSAIRITAGNAILARDDVKPHKVRYQEKVRGHGIMVPVARLHLHRTSETEPPHRAVVIRGCPSQREHATDFHETDSFKSLTRDFSRVPLADMGEFLHHRTQMTFTENKLVGSDPSAGAAQTDPNLINPWGVSESATSPFWISGNGSGFASLYSVTSSGVTTNIIPSITIAVPPGQMAGTASPTGQVFNSFASEGAFTLQDGSPAPANRTWRTSIKSQSALET